MDKKRLAGDTWSDIQYFKTLVDEHREHFLALLSANSQEVSEKYTSFLIDTAEKWRKQCVTVQDDLLRAVQEILFEFEEENRRAWEKDKTFQECVISSQTNLLKKWAPTAGDLKRQFHQFVNEYHLIFEHNSSSVKVGSNVEPLRVQAAAIYKYHRKIFEDQLSDVSTEWEKLKEEYVQLYKMFWEVNYAIIETTEGFCKDFNKQRYQMMSSYAPLCKKKREMTKRRTELECEFTDVVGAADHVLVLLRKMDTLTLDQKSKTTKWSGKYFLKKTDNKSSLKVIVGDFIRSLTSSSTSTASAAQSGSNISGKFVKYLEYDKYKALGVQFLESQANIKRDVEDDISKIGKKFESLLVRYEVLMNLTKDRHNVCIPEDLKAGLDKLEICIAALDKNFD